MNAGEDCFERGTEFIPERWTTRPEMVRNSSAHIPFNIGKNGPIPLPEASPDGTGTVFATRYLEARY